MFVSYATLESGIDEIRRSPAESGTVELIVCRPDTGQRKVLESAELCPVEDRVRLIGGHRRAASGM